MPSDRLFVAKQERPQLREQTNALPDMRFVTVLLCMAASMRAGAQEAVLEVPGVHGECFPVIAAKSDSLELHKAPNLHAKTIVIPYQAGWRIPYPKRQGLTRVISVGRVESLTTGEVLEYLYYLGEGVGMLRGERGLQQGDVDESSEEYRVLSYPDVQGWIPFVYRDGTSPGWLYLDGTQIDWIDVEC